MSIVQISCEKMINRGREVKNYKPFSLYTKLLVKLVIYLIIPLAIVSIILYRNLIIENEKNYNSNIEIIMNQNNNQRESYINNMLQIADSIASKVNLTGFMITKYKNINITYYDNVIRNIVEKNLGENGPYKIKIYYENKTIPRGFGIFYNYNDVEESEIIRGFIESDIREMWVTPSMALNEKENIYKNFKNHYTYLRKVVIEEKVAYILALSIGEEEMDGYLKENYSDSKYNLNQYFETAEYILLNRSSNKIEGQPLLEDLEGFLQKFEKYGYNIKKLAFDRFPQKLIYIWKPNYSKSYIAFGIIVFSILIVIFIMSIIKFIKNIFNTIYQCIDELEQSIRLGNYNKFEMNTRDENSLMILESIEILKIKKMFNQLIDKIQELLFIVAKESSLAKESQLRALQHQINPHFMYNTLEVFAYKMELYEHFEEADAMVSFAEMLRYNISFSSKYATVKDEIAQVYNYINIQCIKYEMKLEVDVPKEMYDIEMIRFILQPIVENSFTHGYKDETLKIYIKAYIEEEYIIFEIKDNGKGMSESKLKELRNALKEEEEAEGQIGLRNINKRLMLFYHGDYQLEIESNLNENMKVIIKIPKYIK